MGLCVPRFFRPGIVAILRQSRRRHRLSGGAIMKVKRIVANIDTRDTAAARRFYQDVLGLDVLMDHGWIVTYGSSERMSVQLSFAKEGGAGTPTPDLSIEVDDLDAALEGMVREGFPIEYGPSEEPWGVRRFFVRDPFGKLVNVLVHREL